MATFILICFIALTVLATGLYFMPSLIAFKRKHHNKTPIFVVNLFLGWSLIGWVLSLAWSCTKVETA